jgi:hypothetical protein
MIAVEEDKESEKEEEPVLEQEGSNDGEEVLQLPGGTGAGEKERAAALELEIAAKLKEELARFMMELKAQGKEANDKDVEEQKSKLEKEIRAQMLKKLTEMTL